MQCTLRMVSVVMTATNCAHITSVNHCSCRRAQCKQLVLTCLGTTSQLRAVAPQHTTRSSCN
eukprot:17682-Heterococcus_DN1.PRE.1